jgi:hypothetical protein
MTKTSRCSHWKFHCLSQARVKCFASITMPAAPTSSQTDSGFLDCDFGGFPNGRRLISDVIDFEITIALGEIMTDNPKGLQTWGAPNLDNLQVVNLVLSLRIGNHWESREMVCSWVPSLA